ncbi:Glycosyltransferase involved in cell wall bisynthesis [Butyrivibrio fibrisolvens DSM 3071]|uniref:Glycosyltransferase involved in cell wall bisynthesis n=1 Tax=Butyrivibrio fibrisolvens DSM 3071 TaxID=1121131 RepID=A0A1M6A7B6_BUTFI|nr:MULTISPECIES: glycosyltransferase family 2 protein [Butyrivibrio]SEQ36234.1 Glycosyltransferase involved in cell wall bisynthesis [Butyrivibrio sp. TB]SHI32317.1 Glycosyltransferase involved in cell wall bisynthesis [Butyrivibrio fibrisolvens DSM 3071]
MKCLLIVPAFNEGSNVEKVINTIKEKCPQADYLVVNDCSTDNTKEELGRIKASYISGCVNLGIGGAVQCGYKYALKNGYDIAIQVDGDGQHDVSYVAEMVRIIESGEADIVIGSRFIDKEGFQSSGARRTGIKFLSGLIFLMTGKHIKDVTSGFRAVNRKFIEVYADDYPDDYPEPEAIVMGLVNGGRIKEMPVMMQERIGGTSSINAKRAVYYMIKVSLAVVIRRISLGLRTPGSRMFS